MRIRCSFTLEPDSHENHSYAIELLKRWQLQEKNRQDDPDTSLNRRNRFHRDLYLSGLVLHQLAPTLPTLLPQVLTENTLTHGNVLNIMQAAELPFSASNNTGSEASGLSDSQWQQLSALLESHANQQQLVVKEELAQIPKPVQAEYPPVLEDMLEQLRLGQELLLHQLQLLTEKTQSVSLPQPDNSAQTTKQLEHIAQEQGKILSQIRALRSEFKQGVSFVPAESAEQPALEDQLAKAAKVKSKRLW